MFFPVKGQVRMRLSLPLQASFFANFSNFLKIFHHSTPFAVTYHITPYLLSLQRDQKFILTSVLLKCNVSNMLKKFSISALAAMMLCGCEVDYSSRQKFPAAEISPRSSWKVSGTLRGCENAIDDDSSTAATTGHSYDNSVIIVDLGKICLFNTIIADHGSDEFGFCRRVAILTSIDGKKYTHQAAISGTRQVSFFNLVTPTLARYIRLQAIVPGNRPWSIAELYLQ